MRARLLAAVLSLGLALFTPAAAQDSAAGRAVIAVLRTGAQDISIREEGAADKLFTWASWTEGGPDHWTTRLALVRAAGSDGAAITWSVQRPDGYGAVLRPTPWQFRGRPVLLLRYQFGAAYTRVELYAAGTDGRATVLGQVEGALVFADRSGADVTLRAVDDALLRGRPRCFGWQAATARLRPITCPARRTASP